MTDVEVPDVIHYDIFTFPVYSCFPIFFYRERFLSYPRHVCVFVTNACFVCCLIFPAPTRIIYLATGEKIWIVLACFYISF